jgi:seryl-tRNA synthetase
MTMGKNREKWLELQWEGQRFYLPKYVGVFRKVEKDIVASLTRLGFQECLFPRLLTYSQYAELKMTNIRFSHEWSKELLCARAVAQLNPDFPTRYILAHWQCEPFYYFLKKAKPRRTLKYFDRSGWTYRMEKDVSDYRLVEFQRIESVWFAPRNEAEEILDTLLDRLTKYFSSLGLRTRVAVKQDEEKETAELMVRDIEAYVDGLGWVEVAGAHLHGRLFINGLQIPADKSFYTGCCGIGTTRLTNILLNKPLVP